MARIDELEEVVHGRRRRLDDEQEMYFGVQMEEPGLLEVAAEGVRPIQVPEDFRPEKRAWTGVVTSIACEMLKSRQVDAVLCVSSERPSPLEPKPILARSVEEKPPAEIGDPAVRRGEAHVVAQPAALGGALAGAARVRGAEIKRLLFIGVGCQVQALRSVEADLGLEELYVLGTNCVDNPRNAEATGQRLREVVGSCGQLMPV
eukprot:Skav226080  [mRNA]  locus=scaffold211:978847:982195:- [translate_table: standard]